MHLDLATVNKSLKRIGANPSHLTEAANELKDNLAANDIKIDPETHSLKSEIHSHNVALRLEESLAESSITHNQLLKGNLGRGTGLKSLTKELEHNGFTERHSGKGTSHQIYFLPDSDITVNFVRKSDGPEYLKQTTAALVRATLRDRDLMKKLHQTQTIAADIAA